MNKAAEPVFVIGRISNQIPKALFTDTLTETEFRRKAGLCTRCGKARRAPFSLEYCELHEHEAQMVEMRWQWKAWGVAA